MSLTMRERQIVIKGMAGAYRRASKKEKGRILEQVVEATGYLRRYAARLLRGQGRRIYRPGGRVLEGDVGTRIRRERRGGSTGRRTSRCGAAVGDAGLCLGEATGGGPAGFDREPGATRRAGGRAGQCALGC